MEKAITKEQVRVAVEQTMALAEAIREAGEIPEGHLYAMVLGVMSLAAFKGAIGHLVRIGLVSRSGSELKWEAA